MRLHIDVHESPAAYLPRLCWIHGIPPQLSVYIKRWPKAIFWTMIMGHRFQHIFFLQAETLWKRRACLQDLVQSG